MKTLNTFLTKCPSYIKCGPARIAKATGISLNTVIKFRKTPEYIQIKTKYYTTVGQ
jgi:hypothetical protein